MYKASGASLDPLQQIMTMATLAENNIMRKNEVVKTKLEPDLSQTRRVAKNNIFPRSIVSSWYALSICTSTDIVKALK